MTRWLRGDGWVALAETADAMRQIGAQLGSLLRAGDLVLLDGPLGAGKTTLVQGLATALRVRGTVTSPTYVIARRHPGPGPALVHADAYRLGTAVELEDLDLDADLTQAVTVVEWGAGKAEELAEERLEVAIDRVRGDAAGISEDGSEPDDPAAGPRTVTVRGVGPRWAELDLTG